MPRPGNRQPPQKPYVPAVFGIPAAAVTQVEQAVHGETEEGPRSACRRGGQLAKPGIEWPVQQRHVPDTGEVVKQRFDRPGNGSSPLGVDTALHRVLDLEPHSRRQRSEVETVLTISGAVGDEVLGGGASPHPPPGVVASTPSGIEFGPQPAPGHCANRGRRHHRRRPPRRVGTPGSIPLSRVPIAQPISELTELAAGHLARTQRPMPGHLRIRRRGPRHRLGPTGVSPPAQMSQAQPVVTTRSHAACHDARRRPQDRVAHRRDQHIDPELRSHRRSQPIGESAQTGNGRSHRRWAHRSPPFPSRTPAATSSRRASSMLKWE